jgi:hypothetical protein
MVAWIHSIPMFVLLWETPKIQWKPYIVGIIHVGFKTFGIT